MLGIQKKIDINDIIGISLFLLVFSIKLNSYAIIFTVIYIIYYIKKNSVPLKYRDYSQSIFLMYFFFMLISLMWTHDVHLGLKELEKSFSLFLFPCLFLFFDLKVNLKKIFSYVVFGALSGFLFCLLYAYWTAYVTADIWTPFRYFNFTKSIGIHPGYLSIYLLISFIFLIEEFFKTTLKRPKYIYGFLCLMCSLSILYIGTKSVFFLLMSIYLFYIIRKATNKRKLIKFIFIFAIVVAALAFLFYNISYGFRTRVFFLLNGRYHNLGERYFIYEGMISIIKDNPLVRLIGLGVGGSQSFLMNYYAVNDLKIHLAKKLATHNIFFKAYLEQGVLGLFFLFSLFQGLRMKYFYKDISYFLFSFVFLSFGLIEHFLDLQHGVVFFSVINVLYYKKNNGL